MNLATSLQAYRVELDRELRAALDRDDLPFYDMLRYHLGWVDPEGRPAGGSAGKALRPTLCFLACEAVGGDWRTCLPAGAAIELIHGFSLIHDDIQDGDRERRHRPTVWAVWGVPQAINAGDAMHVIGALTLLRMSDRGVPPEKVVIAGKLFHRACLRMIEGQYLDLVQEVRLDTTPDDYFAMVAKKTGALLECSAYLGAYFGCDDSVKIERLREFGRAIGRAFQVRDDVLGIWGSAEVLGKSTESDIRRKKKSLPVVYALAHATGPSRQELERIYRLPELTDRDVQTVLAILDEVRARDYAEAQTDAAHEEAREAIAGLELEPSARARLDELAEFLGGRQW